MRDRESIRNVSLSSHVPANLAQLERAAGNKKNIEVVLSTHIIDAEPGTPKVKASYF